MRSTCVLLAACVLVSQGCRTAEERAARDHDRVKVGMTRDEVAGLLGEPYAWKEDPQGFEIWLYAYRPSLGDRAVTGTVDFTRILIGVALLVVYVGLAWLSHGSWPGGFPDLGPANDAPREEIRLKRFTFQVGFDLQTGLVAFVSSPFPE